MPYCAWTREKESRSAVYAATSRMASEAMPTGTGVGSFVRWFEAHAPDSLVRWTYFNHAHNEYLQWWLEGGVLGLTGSPCWPPSCGGRDREGCADCGQTGCTWAPYWACW
ncbi:O-antigen ligase family protein [Pseudoxanthomonas sp. NC8]|nr:O-antigen ligase family protein [Pseudoxanthomonas sp. NC8]